MKKAIFEIPAGFAGPIVLMSDHQSPNEWRAQGGDLSLKVTNSAMGVRNLAEIKGRYFLYEARVNGGASITITPISSDTSRIEFGLFGGFVTNTGDMHFFFGSGRDAVSYFDRLTKK